jgi:hypothetical protein
MELPAEPGAHPAAVSPMPALIEWLSDRERAVLRYLPTLLTFVEIGSELYISVNTTRATCGASTGSSAWWAAGCGPAGTPAPTAPLVRRARS